MVEEEVQLNEEEGWAELEDKDEAPVDKDKPPVDKDEPPVDKDEAPVDKDEAPVDKDEAPVDKDEAPVDKDEAPVDKDEAPVGKDEAPVGKDGSPVEEGEDVDVAEDREKLCQGSNWILSWINTCQRLRVLWMQNLMSTWQMLDSNSHFNLVFDGLHQ